MKLFYLAGGIGAILTLFGLWRLVANFRFLARTTAVEGKLVSWDVTDAGKVGGPSSKDGRRSYRPIVSFRAVDGSEHRVMGAAYRQGFRKPDEPTGSASLPAAVGGARRFAPPPPTARPAHRPSGQTPPELVAPSPRPRLFQTGQSARAARKNLSRNHTRA